MDGMDILRAGRRMTNDRKWLLQDGFHDQQPDMSIPKTDRCPLLFIGIWSFTACSNIHSRLLPVGKVDMSSDSLRFGASKIGEDRDENTCSPKMGHDLKNQIQAS